MGLIINLERGSRLAGGGGGKRGGDSDDPDHRSDLMPISLPKEADQVVRSEATLGF
jgi:hypothetical protein